MNQAKYKVYLLDDDVDDSELLKEAFMAVGCASTVECFETPASLLHQLETDVDRQLPSLIVMDHQMPLLNGGEVVRAIRINKKFISVAIIVYSTSLPEIKVQSLLENGVDYFMAKAHTFEGIKSGVLQFCDVIAKKQLAQKI